MYVHCALALITYRFFIILSANLSLKHELEPVPASFFVAADIFSVDIWHAIAKRIKKKRKKWIFVWW